MNGLPFHVETVRARRERQPRYRTLVDDDPESDDRTAGALDGRPQSWNRARRFVFFLDLRRSHGTKWNSLSSLSGEQLAMNIEEKIQSIPENERLAAATYALNTVLIARGIVTREELEEGLNFWLRRKELLREKATIFSEA
jgi:hypothetical protein